MLQLTKMETSMLPTYLATEFKSLKKYQPINRLTKNFNWCKSTSYFLIPVLSHCTPTNVVFTQHESSNAILHLYHSIIIQQCINGKDN